MKSFITLLFGVFSGLGLIWSVAQSDIKNKPIKDNYSSIYSMVDTLKTSLNKQKKNRKILKQQIDTLQQINDYLKSIMFSHDYRVYTYDLVGERRYKLIYKWEKGKPGHWELYRKVFY